MANNNDDDDEIGWPHLDFLLFFWLIENKLNERLKID